MLDSGITLNIQGDIVTNDADDFAERIAVALPEALRRQNDISNAIHYFIDQNADSLFSITRVDDLTLWQKRNNNWTNNCVIKRWTNRNFCVVQNLSKNRIDCSN